MRVIKIVDKNLIKKNNKKIYVNRACVHIQINVYARTRNVTYYERAT